MCVLCRVHPCSNVLNIVSITSNGTLYRVRALLFSRHRLAGAMLVVAWLFLKISALCGFSVISTVLKMWPTFSLTSSARWPTFPSAPTPPHRSDLSCLSARSCDARHVLDCVPTSSLSCRTQATSHSCAWERCFLFFVAALWVRRFFSPAF